LLAAGAASIEPLAGVVESRSREVANRAWEILASFGNSPIVDLQTQAKAALERLSKSEDKAVAARATLVLHPETDLANYPPRQNGFLPRAANPGGRIIFGGNVQVQFGGAGALKIANGARVVAVQVQNGRRTTKVQEAGKTIEIDESPQ